MSTVRQGVLQGIEYDMSSCYLCSFADTYFADRTDLTTLQAHFYLHRASSPFISPSPASPSSRPLDGTTPISSTPHSFAPFPHPDGLWSDLKTMRWMRVPASSFKMIFYPAIFYLNYRFLQFCSLIPQHWYNPFQPLLFISHHIPGSSSTDPRYRKGYLDILFIAYYVIVWSFVRQAITLYIFHPIARRFGINKAAKRDRFGEQGYALTYFSLMSILGLVSTLLLLHGTNPQVPVQGVMSESGTWWYQTMHFWLG